MVDYPWIRVVCPFVLFLFYMNVTVRYFMLNVTVRYFMLNVAVRYFMWMSQWGILCWMSQWSILCWMSQWGILCECHSEVLFVFHFIVSISIIITKSISFVLLFSFRNMSKYFKAILCMFCRSLFVIISFVLSCLHSIYGFCLPLLYLQTLLVRI